MSLRTPLLAAALLVATSGTAWAQQDTTPRYLPYRVAIPPGQAIDRGPEPYDPARHGPPLANTQPGANIAAQARANLPRVDSMGKGPRGRPGDAGPNLPRPEPGSGDRGFWLSNSVGIYAANDAQTNVVIPDNAVGTTIYAPTHMPAGNACIETVTAHFRYTGQTTTSHGHGFWDHCVKKGWFTYENMDATWKSKYVRTLDGEERYYTQVNKGGTNCWYGLLYNFTSGVWEDKVTPAVCGASTWATGWTMWESHHLMDVAKVCPTFPSIRASALQVNTSSGWVPLTSTYTSQLGPTGSCWTGGTYTFHVHVANSDWHAHTPNP